MGDERRGSGLSRGVAGLMLGTSRDGSWGSRGSRGSRRMKMVIDDNGCTKIPITNAILTSGKNISQRLACRKSMRQIFGVDGCKVNTGLSGRRVSVKPSEGNQSARALQFIGFRDSLRSVTSHKRNSLSVNNGSGRTMFADMHRKTVDVAMGKPGGLSGMQKSGHWVSID